MDEVSTGNDGIGYSGSPSPLIIPTEVCENIIDMLYSHLARDTFQDIDALHSCALVCRAWRVRSQRMLFYKIQLSDGPSIHRLRAILDAGPHLRGYLHEVTIIGCYLDTTASVFAIFPAVFAGKLPNLRRVDVVHLNEGTETASWYPRTSHPPYWAKPLPHIPLHPCVRTFLSSFTAVSYLTLTYTVFRSFSECARVIHALPNLEQLQCEYVRWLAPGGSHPGADIMMPPDWAAGGPNAPLPLFAPRLRQLSLLDIALYEAERLIWTRGPHLKTLDITSPLSEDEQPASWVDLRPCTGLQTLTLSFTPHFSMDTHGRHVAALLSSWQPHIHPAAHPLLVVQTYRNWQFTRQGFADVLHGLGTIAETWLQAEPTTDMVPQAHNHVSCQLIVNICDSEGAREWWSGHVNRCFPTWVRLGRLSWNFEAPPNEIFQWADYLKPLPSDTNHQLENNDIDSDSPFEDAGSLHVSATT